jgi:predicted RNA-binding protein with PUA-like domain
MTYFLAKTDPDTYSTDDFEREGVTVWDGVHNHQAINNIKLMKPGDQVFIYESMSLKSVTALAEVVSEPYLNTKDPRFSWAVKLKFLHRLGRRSLGEGGSTYLSLSQIKSNPAFEGFILIRHTRLSVMQVEEKFAKIILGAS